MNNQNRTPKHKNDRARSHFGKTNEFQKQEETPEQSFSKMYDNFKFQTIKNGTLRELKDRRYFMKKGERKRKKRAEAEQKARQNQKRRARGN